MLFEWTSTNPDVALVDASQTLQGVSAGEAILTVRCGTLERSFPVVVRPSVPIAVRVRTVSGQVRRIAERLPGISALSGGQRKWIGIGAVSALLVAVVAIVAAKLWPISVAPPAIVSDTTTLPPALANQTTLQLVRPLNLLIEPGDTLRLVAQVSPDSASARDSVRWSSSDPTRARVDTLSGLVTAAMDTGAVTITAAFGALRDTVTLGVGYQVATLNIVKVDTVMIGQDALMRVIARSARGKRIQPSSLRWSALPVEIATIDSATGRLHPRSPGIVHIKAVDSTSGVVSTTLLLEVKQARAAEPQPQVVDKPAEPAPKTAVLSDALEPANECRDAFANLDRNKIEQFAINADQREMANIRALFKHLNDSPTVFTDGTGGPNAEGGRAEVRFEMRLRWRPNRIGGRTRTEPFTLRAVLESSGGSWKLMSCHLDRIGKF